MRIYQSRSFEKKVKKISKREKEILDQEVMKIADNPSIGDEKKGDLRGIFVHKFKMKTAEYLLSYRMMGEDLELIMIGPHENYYRDLKKRTWVFNPKSRSKPKVPDDLKTQVQTRANHLIESELKPKHINPPPKDKEFNYIVDIYSKWYQNYFYFCAKYRCPAPNCISEFFEVKFARLEYIEDNRFNLSYIGSSPLRNHKIHILRGVK